MFVIGCLITPQLHKAKMQHVLIIIYHNRMAKLNQKSNCFRRRCYKAADDCDQDRLQFEST